MPDFLIPLISLIALEVVLGIDNIIFISVLAAKLPVEQRGKIRLLGIGIAMILRLILLAFISWILKLDTTLFTIFNIAFSGKSLILFFGGLFLLYKSTKEIYLKTEAIDHGTNTNKAKATFGKILFEVIILDLVFSIDSIITAVGMVSELWVMYVAVIVTVLIMLVASKPISEFITKHPSFKILALCFLITIGVALIAEGLSFKIPKGYIYFSMLFSLFVDVIQMKVNSPSKKTSNNS
jgi:predicted tellurium resistance membrane protein TerC